VWHHFIVRTLHRDALQQHLAAGGIATMIHYPVPPHLQPAYADMRLGRGRFPVTERIHDEVLSLPLGPQLHDDDIDAVAAATAAFFSAKA
jgi:dTDP-4-amino-4,6-dideoxygalactose transaminase